MDPRNPMSFDELALYDAALLALLTFSVEDKEIPTKMGTVQRAHSSAKKRFGALKRNDRIPVPSAVLERGTWSVNPARKMCGARMKVAYLDAAKSVVLMGKTPQPVDISYKFRVTLAAPEHQNAVLEEYESLFHQSRTVMSIDVPEWSSALCAGVSTGDLEPGESEVEGDDVFTLETSLTVEGFLFDRNLTTSRVIVNPVVTFEEY